MPVMSFVFFIIIFLREASRTPHKIFVEMDSDCFELDI